MKVAGSSLTALDFDTAVRRELGSLHPVTFLPARRRIESLVRPTTVQRLESAAGAP